MKYRTSSFTIYILYSNNFCPRDSFFLSPQTVFFFTKSLKITEHLAKIRSKIYTSIYIHRILFPRSASKNKQKYTRTTNTFTYILRKRQTNTRIANNINMSIPTIISTPSVQKNLEQNNDDNNNNNEILSPSTSNNTTNTNNNNIILPPSSIQAPIAAIPTIISSSASTTTTTTKTNIAIPISISSSTTTTSSNTTASVQQQSQQQQSGTICPKCGSTNIDRDDASGNAVCMACGTVIEENTIVSSVQFAESSGGSSSIVGQYVAATATKSFTSGMSNRGITYSKESREITINNGRKRIAQLAAKLRLG